MSRWFEKYVTGGGCSKRVASDSARKRFSAVIAVMMAIAITCSVAVPGAYANPLEDLGNAISNGVNGITQQLFGISLLDAGEPELYSVGDEVENSAVADRDSTNDWNAVLMQDGQVSTQNIGRIWTDKSVFTEEYTLQGSTSAGGTTITKAEGSDFLVGLSALSSTSNLKTVTTTTTPLDIVLVLDVSGSMDDQMSGAYTETYSIATNRSYYVNVDGEWHEVDYSNRQRSWYYETGFSMWSETHYVTPKTSASDSNPDHVQFYTYQTVSKMDSLKSAAGEFIDSVNTMNAALPEGSEQHRIAIVKFASNSSNNIGDDMYEVPGSDPRYQNRTQIVSDFSTNAIALDNAVNALDPAGATRADLGLEQAARVLNGGDNLSGAREGAKKVVIFFTDGNPTSGSSWENSVASAAVDNAYQLKNTNGATVYSIGVVSGANPDSDPTSDNTSNINKFLHSVSSNYKSATYQYEYGWLGGSYQWDLGDRTPAPEGSTEVPQYYYAAEDSAQLDQVFQDITTSIGQDNASGSPIEDVTTEGETNPGNLTFNDELGAYMEVAGDTMQIVYADQTFTSSRRTSQTIEGGVVYTYPFSGTVHANEAYGDKVANLSSLQIKVTHYDDPAKGDLVEAVIPADLIPMRNYDVDTENGTMTVSSTYPVRLFYSVQVKAEAAEQLADPSSAIYTSNYVANNTNDAGTGVEFYSNLYTNSDGEGFVGDTTATFKPSNGNRFYYFTANTPLYTSNDGIDTQADRNFISGDNTVYYKDTYWVQTDGTVEDPETGERIPAAKEKTEYIPLSTSDIRDSVRYTPSGAYLPPQTHNEDRIERLYADKGENGNPTETAGDTLNPTWTVIQDDNGDNVSVISARMGNNGRLALELPGTLAVSKNVTFGGQYGNTGFDATDYTEDKSYDINITLTGEDNQAVSGTYKAQVKNAQGDVVSDPTDGYFVITFTNGKATQSIKHGETLYIYGLDAGATYEVTETAPGDGFTTTYDDNAKGTIEINETSSTTVTNTYTLQSTELAGSTDLKVSKKLNNRDWREGDSFTFQIEAGQTTPNAPMPEKTAVTIDSTNKDDGASFGNISYSTPGQYVYIISEFVPTEDALTGVTYSRARYRVVVDVKDNGKGAMTATSTMTQIMDDAGNAVADGAAIDTHTAAFTNTYRTSDEGGTANLGGTKRFVDETGATKLADWTFDFTLTAVGGYPTDNKPGEPGAEDTAYPIAAANVPMPDGAQGTSKTVTLSGGAEVFNFGNMTYDGNDVGNTYVYAITEVAGNNNKMTYDGDTEYVTVTVTEVQDGDVAVINAVADRAAANVVFENSYTPESAKLTGGTALGGTKTITGRDMLEGESYDFTLEYVSGVDGTTPAEDGWIELPADEGMTASVTGANKGVETAFNFGGITFNHVGEYKFTISENVPTGEDALGGMTYDNHKCTVTVDVTYDKDNNKLVASTDYGIFDNRAGNEFVNEYKSNFNYGTSNSGGLNVSKTLTGRDMLDGEFSFTIAPTQVDGNPALAEDKLGADDKNFSNGGANDGVANVMNKLRLMTFDQDDAGKTFIYTVAETKGNLLKVDYDTNVYTVEIKVVDDNDGTMHTETTVKNASGEQVGEVATWDDQATENSTVATVAFENTYTPDTAELTKGTDTGLKVTKKVTGAPTDADFNFTLVLTGQPDGSKVGGMDDDGEGNMIATTTVDHNFTADEVAAGTTSEGLFGTLTFNKAGTYTFDIVENEAQGEGAEDKWPAGWKYDTSTRQYTVVVTDENPAHATDENQPLYDGKLYIQSVDPSNRNQTFTNSYDHGSVTIGGDAVEALTVEKTVKGWSTDADFNFTFVPVKEEGVDWGTVQIAEGADKTAVTEKFADGDMHSAKFGEITFTEPGTYKFNVTEDEAHDETADPAGWTYDKSTQTITVTVSETDAAGSYDGKLHAAVSGPATFENTYKAGTATVEGGEATFAGTKTIDGRDWLKNETFGFKLTKGDVSEGTSWDNVTYLPVNAAEDTEPVAFESASATANEKNDKNGTFWFAGTYLFSKPGTYTFNVTETQHNSEDLPEDGTNGMTYDRHVGTITVEVTDNGSGTLQAKVTPGTDDASVEFVNTFEGKPYTFGLEADEMPSGHKTVEDNVGSFQMADDQFTFVMRAQDKDNPMPDNLTVETDTNGYNVVSVKNTDTDAQAYTADYSFGSITFDHDDLAGVTDDDNDGKISKAFQYNVYENETDMPAGVSAVNPGCMYTVTITVTEDLATGEITAEGEAVLVNPGDAENDPATLGSLDFVNKYDAGTITGGIQIYKTLSGRNWQQGDTFTFDVTMKADGVAKDDLPEFNFDNLAGPVADYTEADGELSYNITINPSRSATGNSYAFGTGIPTYTHEGTYVYTITERDSTVAGVTKDSSTYVVTVVIEDVEQGGEHVLNRTATITRDGEPYESTGRVDFTNTYTAAGTLDGATVLDVQKSFTGRENNEWTDNDVFTFKLTGSVGAPMPKNDQGDVVDTITLTKNELADGVATGSFGDIAYGNADRGKSYTYTITEVAGNVYGVDYSEAEYKVTVTVNDKATPDGTLVIVSTVEKTKDDNGAAVDPASAANVAAFTNTYKVNDDTKTVDRVDEDVKTDVDGKLVGVGDTLEYTIHWVNDAINETGVAQDATVTVVDKLPAGVTLDQDSIGEGVYDADAGTITWTINAKAAQEGDITYSVTVNDEALQTDELTNTAQVTVGDNNPHQSVETTVHVPQKSVKNDREDAADGDLKVGDTLTYTIEYTNDADEPATITVTDPVPAGLTVTQDDIQDGGTLADGTITWVIENVAAGQSGAVHFSGVVNETALTEGADNQATIQVGEDGPVIKTNTVPGTLKTGTLSISKTVKLGSDIDNGVNAISDDVKRFEFKLTMVDAKGKPLTNAYTITGGYDGAGNSLTSVKSGESIFLGDDESATISGLPIDAKVTVEEIDVADDGYVPETAKQDATIDADGETLAFVNVYDAEGGLPEDPEGNGSLVITKQLNNRAMTEGQFSFTIEATGENAAAAAKKIGITEGTFTTVESDDGPADTAVPTTTNPFVGMKFDEHDDDVTYTYTVKENGESGNGYTLDDEVYTVAITAHDQKNGTMSVDVSVKDKEGNIVSSDPETGITTIPFVNSYDADSVVVGVKGEAKIEATKTLNNAELSDKQFTFDVVSSRGDKSATVATGTNAADGTITFGDITYTTANLNAAITEAGSAEVGWATVEQITDEETGKQKDVYTFNYTVSEQTPDENTGITANSGVQSVTVTVTDDGTGKLSVAVAYDGEKEGLAFENTYGGDAKFSLYITGNKVISADEGITPPALKAGDFEFTIAGSEGAPMPDVKTVSNTDAGTVSFGPIEYTMENVFGTDGDANAQADETDGEQQAVRTKTFTYTITESQDKTVAGVTNDTTTKTVEVTVTDLGGGKIKAEVTSEKTAAGTDFTFTNTYKVKGTDDEPTKDDGNGIKVTKKLTGRVLSAGEFTFKLYDASGNEVASGANDANGNVTLSDVHFDKPGFYTYSLREVEGDLDGVTYDRTAYSVSARVIDTGGTLSVTWTVINGTGNEALFTNTFTPADTPDEPTKDEGGITITKKLEGRALEAGEFSFELVDEDDNVVATGKNDANGDVALSDVTFTEAGEYHYTLREVAGDLDNVTYDDTVYHVTATVTAGDDGKLQVVWKIADEGVKDNTATFHNVYKKPVTPPTPVDPDPSDPSKPGGDVDKKLTGRDLVAGEFSFTITATSDNASHVSPKSLTGTNDASGNVTFGGKGFVFDEAGDYTFIVAEVLPSDDDPDTEGVQHNGVTYDPATFTITAHVTEQNGKLVVTWENADVPMVFENEYEPEETVDITFGATKVLEGRDLAAGEFSFELRDQDGNVVATATNAADGSIVFTSPVTFTEPGEYTYTIVEVSGNVSGVTYDDAVHTAVVTVTDNGDGTLSATVTYDGSGKLPVFTNVFTPSEPGKPEKPSKPGIPQTGDFAVAAIGGTGLAAVALIATGLYLRRRNSH